MCLRLWSLGPSYIGFWILDFELIFKFKPELELVLIGLDMTTNSSSALNLTINPKHARNDLDTSSIVFD